MKKNCIVIYGPTAAGKTELALRLADLFPVEIINMDSVQIYKGFNIGAAKPSKQEMKAYPHHLIDIAEVPARFSVANYLSELDLVVQAIIQRGKIPLIVGGTMLYLKGIVDGGVSDVPELEPAIYTHLKAWLEHLTQRQRYDWLCACDPIWAQKIHPHDQQRTMRGLMVYLGHNVPLSKFHANGKQYDFKPLMIALDCQDRPWLHNKIAERTQKMLDAGLVDEVITLVNKHPSNLDHSIFRSIGYRQVIDFIRNPTDANDLKEAIIVATRQFSKRQMTWMKQIKCDILYDIKKKNIEKIATMVNFLWQL